MRRRAVCKEVLIGPVTFGALSPKLHIFPLQLPTYHMTAARENKLGNLVIWGTVE